MMIKSVSELEFAIFCIEGIAGELGVSPEKAYSALAQKSDILNEYIIKHYDALHTQGKAYILADIISQLNQSGVTL